MKIGIALATLLVCFALGGCVARRDSDRSSLNHHAMDRHKALTPARSLFLTNLGSLLDAVLLVAAGVYYLARGFTWID